VWFGADDLGLEVKGDGSPVTRADREAERAVREVIGAACPSDAILGEEMGGTNGEGDSPYRWIVDPIDGTFSFARAVPLFATLIALQDTRLVSETDTGIVSGVIHLPGIEETVYATRGRGATWLHRSTKRPARVSSVATIEDATVCFTSLEHFKSEDSRRRIDRLLMPAKHSRGWSDAFAPLLLATGRCDVVVERGVHVWDVAPWAVIVEEAGGRFSDWQGRADIDGGRALATNGQLHGFAVEALSGE
jgi:histidinol-phosphatase